MTENPPSQNIPNHKLPTHPGILLIAIMAS
jgi:hypothetical protein